MCAGHDAGCEAAIHALRNIFDQHETEAVMLIDAANAFNSVNRKAFLHNVKVICPSIATFVVNCYSTASRLFVVGGTELRSDEGTTQGDPIAMFVYAIATIPLILHTVSTIEGNSMNTKTAGYADDIFGGGTIEGLRCMWDSIEQWGPEYGYFQQASKSWLIVKPQFVAKARKIFANTGVQITIEGKKHLGAVIGFAEYREEFVNEKIATWIDELTILSQIALIAPQEAYTCFTAGYKHKFNFCMRTIPGISHEFKKIDELIMTRLIPAITGGIIPNDLERDLFSLPPSFGGLGIPIFSEIAEREFNNSQVLTDFLQKNIIEQKRQNDIDQGNLRKIKSKMKSEKVKLHQRTLETIRERASEKQNKLIDISTERGASLWLSTLPIKDEGFQIDKQSFWDLLKIRYGHQLSRLPELCACGASFNLEHSLSCKKGGFVTLRHNTVRDITARLLSEVCKDVRVEPGLIPLSGEFLIERTANRSEEARLDIAARGFWVSGQKAFFDIRVFNPTAGRYKNTKLNKAFEMNEKEKKKSYNQRVLEVEQGSFTPLVFNAMGGIGREARTFYNRLSELLADKRKEHLSVVTTWVRRKMIFSLMRSVVLCLRGSRIPWSQDHLASSVNNNTKDSETTCAI